MRKGVNVVENILMARALMYSSVYFHKTVRIPELMLSKAIEENQDAEPFEFFRMTDAELLTSLQTMGRFPTGDYHQAQISRSLQTGVCGPSKGS